jgi:hypothetical protein
MKKSANVNTKTHPSLWEGLVRLGWGGFLFFLLLFCVSCNDDDTFTTSPSNVLSMPFDTLKMDTVFAKIPAASKDFWIYNHSGDGIRCASVRLQKGNQSGFRVNVDGIYLGERTGYQTSDVEVRKNDSIRVFVELTSPDNGSELYKDIDDKLIFRLESGVEQVITLNAFAWKADMVRNLEIKNDTTIDTTVSGRALVVYGGIKVNPEATLTLAPGTTIYFHDDAGIDVMGKLICKGTAEKSVTLRGDRLDNILGDIPYDVLSGRWQGIHFATSSYDNIIEYTDMHGGKDAIVCDSSDVTRKKLTVNSSTIHNFRGYGLALTNSNAYVANTQISNTYNDCVYVCGGELTMIHNTIAQFYPFSRQGDTIALRYANINEDKLYPLTNLEVKNCIITGWAEDALLKENSDSVAFNYHFYNSLIRMSELKDSVSAKYFEGVIRDNEKDTTLCYSHKNFKNVNPHTEDYLFDFHLDSLSKANGAADARWMLPLNREGIARDEKKVNAGCY